MDGSGLLGAEVKAATAVPVATAVPQGDPSAPFDPESVTVGQFNPPSNDVAQLASCRERRIRCVRQSSRDIAVKLVHLAGRRWGRVTHGRQRRFSSLHVLYCMPRHRGHVIDISDSFSRVSPRRRPGAE